MMVAIVVDSRPRTCPAASITNHLGSMSPCFGKYVRMTLPETTRLIASSEFPRRRCEQPQREELQRQPHTFPTERGETVTSPNRACQPPHSLDVGKRCGGHNATP